VACGGGGRACTHVHAAVLHKRTALAT